MASMLQIEPQSQIVIIYGMKDRFSSGSRGIWL